MNIAHHGFLTQRRPITQVHIDLVRPNTHVDRGPLYGLLIIAASGVLEVLLVGWIVRAVFF